MTKKILPFLLIVAICFTAFFSCKKNAKSTVDATLNYFPLVLGKHVTYNVDSIYYNDTNCTQTEVKSQMMYAISDTITYNKKLSYIMDVFTRPYDGAIWQKTNVIFITRTATQLLYYQDQSEYVKLEFPVTNGFSWPGNQYVEVGDSMLSYLANWSYTYSNFNLSYFNGSINFDHTVSVLETDQTVNYPSVDSNEHAYRTYAKEVYALNVGMIYKEWTHQTYQTHTDLCVKGYRVVMQAIDYN